MGNLPTAVRSMRTLATQNKAVISDYARVTLTHFTDNFVHDLCRSDFVIAARWIIPSLLRKTLTSFARHPFPAEGRLRPIRNRKMDVVGYVTREWWRARFDTSFLSSENKLKDNHPYNTIESLWSLQTSKHRRLATSTLGFILLL